MATPRRIFATLIGASALAATGVAVAAIGPRTFGGILVLAGWVALIAALHRLGRGGAG